MYKDWRDALTILPSHMRDGMERYIQHGVEGGSFMNTVLENDFVHAYQRADWINRENRGLYADYLFHYAPMDCWGNRLKVQKWIASGGLSGIMDSQRVQADEEC